MSTTPISDEDFEAQLTLALASLEGGSTAELADDAIAKHLLEASGDKFGMIETIAETDFSRVNKIKVTAKGSVEPVADGTTSCTCKCFALSR